MFGFVFKSKTNFSPKSSVNKSEYSSFLTSALTLTGSVTPKVFKNVFWVFLYAVTVSVVNLWIPHAELPIGPFEYAGIVMALILVFRVNAGYDRWWEARKIWGDIVNKSRNLAIMLLSYTDVNLSKSEQQDLEKCIKTIAAVPYCIKKSLRGNKNYDDLQRLLDKQTIDELEVSDHSVLTLSSKIAEFLSKLVKNNKLNQFSYLKAEEQREKIIDDLGACERILKTPMPFVMAIKARRFILLFILALPWALVDASIFICPIVTSLVAYAFLSLDQIGVDLQNPFSEENLSHLPLTNISQTIEKNILGLLAAYHVKNTINSVHSEKFEVQY